MSAGKGSADTRTPNRAARETAWERIWGKFRQSEEGADGVSEDRKEEKKYGDFSQGHRGTE